MTRTFPWCLVGALALALCPSSSLAQDSLWPESVLRPSSVFPGEFLLLGHHTNGEETTGRLTITEGPQGLVLQRTAKVGDGPTLGWTSIEVTAEGRFLRVTYRAAGVAGQGLVDRVGSADEGSVPPPAITAVYKGFLDGQILELVRTTTEKAGLIRSTCVQFMDRKLLLKKAIDYVVENAGDDGDDVFGHPADSGNSGIYATLLSSENSSRLVAFARACNGPAKLRGYDPQRELVIAIEESWDDVVLQLVRIDRITGKCTHAGSMNLVDTQDEVSEADFVKIFPFEELGIDSYDDLGSELTEVLTKDGAMLPIGNPADARPLPPELPRHPLPSEFQPKATIDAHLGK